MDDALQPQQIRVFHLDNGLTLVVESMPAVRSAAFSFLLPAGSVFDPEQQNGTASVLCELLVRGAGDRDSRQLSAALDDLGVQRSESVGRVHLSLRGVTTSENLLEALRLYADIVQRPRLPQEEFEAAKASVEQTLRSLQDEPRQKVIVELRRRHYQHPWGQPPDGELDHLPNIDPETVRGHYERHVRPNGAVLGVAGNVDPDAVHEAVQTHFGNWPTKPEPELKTGPRGKPVDHIHQKTAQTHIGLAYPAVPFSHPDYYAAWAAVSVLSGGMSSRLFTEVRERRALCYAVYATLSSLPHEGCVLCYAGTTSERAQETLDVTVQELKRLAEGISDDELARCKARAKSSLVMQQESTMSRAGSIARDWYFLGRVRTLSEIHQRIDELTVPKVLDYVHQHPATGFTLLTIGPSPLEPPSDVRA